MALGALLVWVAFVVLLGFRVLQVGFDYDTYMAAADRWLAGGNFYLAYQLAGPYAIITREVLYQPILIPLLIPFSILPAVLWWIVPIGIMAAVVGHWRPSMVGQVGILA
ncbi:MAG: hypothetical protein ACRDGQ_10415, partial [Candidatus Limnocylindrales bacterium]